MYTMQLIEQFVAVGSSRETRTGCGGTVGHQRQLLNNLFSLGLLTVQVDPQRVKKPGSVPLILHMKSSPDKRGNPQTFDSKPACSGVGREFVALFPNNIDRYLWQAENLKWFEFLTMILEVMEVVFPLLFGELFTWCSCRFTISPAKSPSHQKSRNCVDHSQQPNLPHTSSGAIIQRSPE